MAFKKEKSYYRIVKHPTVENALVVKKFDADVNFQGEYNLTHHESNNGGYYDCDCPASKFDCRHKEILRQIKDRGEIGGSRFFCYDTKTFHDMGNVDG